MFSFATNSGPLATSSFGTCTAIDPITEPVTVYNMMITYGSAHDIIRNPCEWDTIGTAVYDMELMQK